MHLLLAVAAALGVYLGVPSAHATDLSGLWVIDQPVWRRQLDITVAALLAHLPAEDLARMRARGVNPAEALRRAAAEGLAGTIEFLPGGIVRSVSRADGVSDDGHWALDGDVLRVEVGDVEGFTTLAGAVRGDRIMLAPVVDPTAPADEPLRRMVYPLLRRQ